MPAANTTANTSSDAPKFWARPGLKKLEECEQLRHILGSWVNLLLVFIPIGIGLAAAHAPPAAVFATCFIAIIPLAGIISTATETISKKREEKKWIGSLMNATFGNATEIIVSIIALFTDQKDVAMLSLVGSIFSNLLVVFPTIGLIGAKDFISQNFNANSARTHTQLLVIGAGVFLLISLSSKVESFTTADIDIFSRVMSISFMASYLTFIFIYRLWTHKNKLEGRVEESERRPSTDQQGLIPTHHEATREPKVEEESPVTVKTATWALALATGTTGVVAYFLLDAISTLFGPSSVISRAFLALIILPIIGNVTEHWSAFVLAKKDQMTGATDIAIGSALQIMFFVIPLLVVVSWIAGVPSVKVGLEFELWQSALLFLATLAVKFALEDGSTDWLEGLAVLLLFIFLATMAARS
ncbi:Sodium/calcium exchanger protein-domain-containing protein [Mycena filopes]|nr:Sodium/calcium exchanger protein-domain-containing protein [Mycena filopes]